MADRKPAERNPIVLPGFTQDKRPRCPKCGGTNFTGRNIQGTINWTCLDSNCGNRWQGGLPHVPTDPREPALPENPMKVDPISFESSIRKGEIQEVKRRVDLTQSFRKGLPMEDGEYNDR